MRNEEESYWDRKKKSDQKIVKIMILMIVLLTYAAMFLKIVILK